MYAMVVLTTLAAFSVWTMPQAFAGVATVKSPPYDHITSTPASGTCETGGWPGLTYLQRCALADRTTGATEVKAHAQTYFRDVTPPQAYYTASVTINQAGDTPTRPITNSYAYAYACYGCIDQYGQYYQSDLHGAKYHVIFQLYKDGSAWGSSTDRFFEPSSTGTTNVDAYFGNVQSNTQGPATGTITTTVKHMAEAAAVGNYKQSVVNFYDSSYFSKETSIGIYCTTCTS